MLRCEKCGSINIQEMAWVDANTHEYIEEGLNGEYDRWCVDCEEHINFVDDGK